MDIRLKKAALLLSALVLWSSSSLANPFSRFNKPVDISSWRSACKMADNNYEDKYAKGYCAGVRDAYMNQLEKWCVPEEVTWGEVYDYLSRAISEANIKPLSPLDIGDWMENAMQVKWPCVTPDRSGLVTDPDLIKELNRLKREKMDKAGTP